MTAARPDLTDGTVRLRAPRAADAQARFRLGNTPEIHHMFGADPDHVPAITKAHAHSWYHAQLDEPLAWIIEYRRRMIGALRLHTVQSWDARANVAIGLLDPACLGKGLGTRALHLIAGHSFGALALHRLSARVLAYNARALASYRKVGFVEEGRERQSAHVAGAWHDDVMMGLIKPEYIAPVYEKPKARRAPAKRKPAARAEKAVAPTKKYTT